MTTKPALGRLARVLNIRDYWAGDDLPPNFDPGVTRVR